MLGVCSRNGVQSNRDERDVEVDIESKGPQRNTDPSSEDFRIIQNTNRENSEITTETASFINCEVSSQVAKKLHEIKWT